MRTAELPGARIRYEESGGEGSGEGPPVVFLHAGSGSSRMWEHQIPAFTGAGFRFIAYDRRSDGVAADDLDALAEHLGLERFHLVGTAAGGIVAVDYALSFPERLRSLVIANSIVGVQDEDYLALSRSLRPAPQFDALPAEVKELGPSYHAAPHRRRRPLHPAFGAAALRRALSQLRIGCRARVRPLRVLGTAGYVQ
jgi:pimeloyl-ACP methyl ester carboxylesterase